MKLFHIGVHKTGTTSLQRHLFRCSGLPYFGVEGEGDWLSARVPWLRYLLEGEGALPTDESDFVFSEEGLLLRAGMVGTGKLAGHIAAIDGACVLITIREPSALLRSAYFQSLSLRGSALGYSGSRRLWPQPTTRFQGFPEWWIRQTEALDISLAGLLHYAQLYERFTAVMGKDRVRLLPIEWLKECPGNYAEALVSLGFPQSLVDQFLLSPPENAGHNKQLTRLRPLVFKTFERSRIPKSHWLERMRRKRVLGPALLNWMYGGAAVSVGGPSSELLAEIRHYYEAQWHDALSIAESAVTTTVRSGNGAN